MSFLIECNCCGILTTVLLFVVGVLGFHYVYFLWNADYWKKKGVFSPNPRAIFGDLPGQITGKKHMIYELDELYQKYEKHHPYIGIFHFRQPRLLVFDPDVIKQIMVTYFKNFQGTELYDKVSKNDKLFGDHSFIKIGDEWRNKRQELTPAFTNNRIKAIFPVSQDVMKKMIEYIKREIAKPNHDGFDGKDLTARYTLSIVSNSIYNIDAKCFDDDEESEIFKISRNILCPTRKAIMMMTLAKIYDFVDRRYKMKFCQDETEQYFIQLMNDAMEYREQNKIERVDYLDHLLNLKAKKQISDSAIAQNGASFLIDGFDTSSSAIAAALYEIGKHKEIQEKLRDIIFNEMPTEDEFNYDNINSCVYLDQVWNECLRLHSPGTYLSRLCTEPFTMDMPKDKKLSFEFGDMILFPVLSIHKNPDIFPEPEKFDPDRFSPENGGAKHYIDNAQLFTFGIGPRACVGNRFAISQSKIAIASLVRNFEVSINPKTPEKFELHPQAFINTLDGSILDLKPITRD